MLLTILRSILLICSFLGYISYLSHRMKPELAIGFFMACLGSLLFVAGMLGILPAMTIAIGVVGLLLLVKDRFSNVRVFLSFGFLFFAAACVGLAFLLKDAEFTAWDNFSHWGVVSRLIIQKNRFPSERDYIIIFTSYPPGTAAFIYFFAFITGVHAEWMYLFAQAVLVTGMTCGVFALAKDLFGRIAAAAGVVLLALSNIAFTDLRVDNVLAATVLGAVSFCLSSRKTLHRKVWYVIPWLTFLTAIKNSGLMLAGMVFLFLLVIARNKKERILPFCIVGISPVICLLLWQARVRLVFPSGLTSFHAMSVDYYTGVLEGKNADIIRQTVQAMMHRVFSLSNPFLILLPVFILLPLAARLFKLKNRLFLRLSVLCVVSYIVYQAGTLLTYIVSMPASEALSLASYSRYHGTILTILAGIGVLLALLLYRQTGKTTPPRNRLLSGALCAAVICAAFFCLRPDFSQLRRQDLDGTLRGRMDALAEDASIPANRVSLIVADEDIPASEIPYLYMMSRYLFNSPSMDVKAVGDPDIRENWKVFHYILTLGDSETMNALTREIWQTEDNVIKNPYL